MTASLAAMAALVATGYGWELLVLYLLPQRRVGWERLLTPLMLYQNYHLVHHIHPTIAFYRYVQVWRRTESDFLDRDVPISTAWGSELTASEYRAWRQLTTHVDRDADLPRWPHRLTVSEVRRLTTDSVSITFSVPRELQETFRFTPGQNVVVGADLDGEIIRRNYSLCTAAGSGVLRIAVRRVEGGRFSTHAHRDLAVGDQLEVSPPSVRFGLTPSPGFSRHLAAVAAGSGITPVISIIASVLAAEPGSRATLLYANRDAAATMFADELSMLTRQYEGRLTVHHHHSQGTAAAAHRLTTGHEQVHTGRLDRAQLSGHLRDPRLLQAQWFLCGPVGLLTDVQEVLAEHGVPADHVHRELFEAPDRELEHAALAEVVPAELTVTFRGREHQARTRGTASVLEAVLDVGLDVPYVCTGGICGTCRATLTHGTVHQQQNYALSEAELAQGAILTCQSRPTSPTVALDYDR